MAIGDTVYLIMDECTRNTARASGPYFKKLVAADAGAMHELEKQCFSLPWSLDQCRGALHMPAFAAFGLWRGASLLAYVSAYHINGELEILNVGVIPAERRQGHARKLLSLLLQAANKMGMQKAVLEVRESNSAAISLYCQLGFRQSGIRRSYYGDTGENALVFTLVQRP